MLKGDISIEHVKTKEQLADILRKPLDEKGFSKLRCELNILESPMFFEKDTHPNTYAKLMT